MLHIDVSVEEVCPKFPIYDKTTQFYTTRLFDDTILLILVNGFNTTYIC